VPIVFLDKVVAVMFLGFKNDKKFYTIRDIEFLEKLSSKISLALGNTFLYNQALKRIKK